MSLTFKTGSAQKYCQQMVALILFLSFSLLPAPSFPVPRICSGIESSSVSKRSCVCVCETDIVECGTKTWSKGFYICNWG